MSLKPLPLKLYKCVKICEDRRTGGYKMFSGVVTGDIRSLIEVIQGVKQYRTSY